MTSDLTESVHDAQLSVPADGATPPAGPRLNMALDTDMKSQSRKPINFAWSRFALFAGGFSVAVALVILPDAMAHGWHGAWPAPALLTVSVLGFSAFGWRRLRTQSASGHLPSTETSVLLRHLVGRPVVAVLWFLATLAAAIMVGLLPVLT